jgi:hypothetical protein
MHVACALWSFLEPWTADDLKKLPEMELALKDQNCFNCNAQVDIIGVQVSQHYTCMFCFLYCRYFLYPVGLNISCRTPHSFYALSAEQTSRNAELCPTYGLIMRIDLWPP